MTIVESNQHVVRLKSALFATNFPMKGLCLKHWSSAYIFKVVVYILQTGALNRLLTLFYSIYMPSTIHFTIGYAMKCLSRITRIITQHVQVFFIIKPFLLVHFLSRANISVADTRGWREGQLLEMCLILLCWIANGTRSWFTG
jgi:hypothetical protein